MTSSNESPDRYPLSYWRVAWQSALAAALCLGLPIAVMFWVLILSRLAPSRSITDFLVLLQNTWYPLAQENGPPTPMHNFLMTLQMHVTPPVLVLSVGVLGWGFLLSKISRYRAWWRIAIATLAGILVGEFPIDWLDLRIQQPFWGWPVHMRFALFLGASVFCVALTTGLALGLLLRNVKASLILAAASSVASVLAVIAVDLILERVGLRVGHGNLAMPKLTAVGTMAAAIAGGTVLGVLFTRYHNQRRTNNRTT
jgi:hypothetical protein